MAAPNHGYRVLENEWVALGDGTRLAARVWLPDEIYSGPVPAVLEYLPYKRRAGTEERDDETYAHFARAGYAGVRIDIRGNGESDGLMEDEYTAQELSDGVEAIAWIAEQDWCDGNVGIIGISWGGFNGLQIAALRPPALKAVITVCSTDDRYADDIHYMGGCLLNDNLTWSQQMLNYSSRPPDPEILGDAWRDVWLERLDKMPFLAANWLKHQRRDDFWRHGSVCENYSDIDIPVLAVGGWYDAYTNAIPRLLAGLSGPAKGIIGPWEHRYPHVAKVGPAIDFLGECVRWWDCWLKGKDNGAAGEPALRAYLMQDAPASSRTGHRHGRWVAEGIWPSANIAPSTYYLTDTGLSQTGAGEGRITISSPMDLGLMAGNFCPGMRIDDELPDDQCSDDEKSVTFDTPVLDEGVAILGAATFEFEFTCSTPTAMLVARLCDVAPDGSSVRVSINPLNLAHLDGHEVPEMLEPGRRYSARLQLSDAGYIFSRGHRIRLALSSSYWPLLWPSAVTPVIELVRDTCRLTLPVRPTGDDQPVVFDPPGEPMESNFAELRPASDSRKIERGDDGTVMVEFSDDMGLVRNQVTGLEDGSSVRHSFWIKPDDPLSAKTEAAWEFETRRGDWEVTTRTSSTMIADETRFYLSQRLEAYEAGKLVFRRERDEVVERDLG